MFIFSKNFYFEREKLVQLWHISLDLFLKV